MYEMYNRYASWWEHFDADYLIHCNIYIETIFAFVILLNIGGLQLTGCINLPFLPD